MKSSRNQTISVEDFSIEEIEYLQNQILDGSKHSTSSINILTILNKLIHGDMMHLLPYFPRSIIDLIIFDPPYNLNKKFGDNKFKTMSSHEYSLQIEKWILELRPLLKPNGTIYVCSDWRSSDIMRVLSNYFYVQNRITWQRDKGRAANNNYKNNSEDIWFCTMDKNVYTFNPNAIKTKKSVIAPYKDENKEAKDWFIEKGKNYRLTACSNIFTDITVPFWSMPENSTHDCQKPEKLIAKLILASSNEKDLVLDSMVGSGTTCVVAKKLNRNFIGIELDNNYCLIAQKRINMVNYGKDIQGYKNGYFLERNSNE